jgi:hypothetical protein
MEIGLQWDTGVDLFCRALVGAGFLPCWVRAMSDGAYYVFLSFYFFYFTMYRLR